MHLTPPRTNRIEIADVLRGIAVMGITLIHFIERFSLNSFPEETCAFLQFTDKVIWDSVFFTISGKAYCIFALLFGFSFYIQDNSQKEKGRDFRGRFAWRLVLLFVIACINSTLFPGDPRAVCPFGICPDCSMPSVDTRGGIYSYISTAPAYRAGSDRTCACQSGVFDKHRS